MINAYARLMSIYAIRHPIIFMHGTDCASYNSSSLSHTVVVDIWNLSLKMQQTAVLSQVDFMPFISYHKIGKKVI